MKQEQWTQLLVGVVILGAIGYLGNLVINMKVTLGSVQTSVEELDNRVTRITEALPDMKVTLGSVQTSVEELDNRVTRIAEALPDLQVRVAWEEVNGEISGFVSLLEPQLKENGWVTTAAIYNSDSEELKIYSLAGNKPCKKCASYLVVGKLQEDAPRKSSFFKLTAYSNALKQPVTIPAKLDGKTSFVLRSVYPKQLDKFLGTLTDENPQKIAFGKIRNWAQLSKDLDRVADNLP